MLASLLSLLLILTTFALPAEAQSEPGLAENQGIAIASEAPGTTLAEPIPGPKAIPGYELRYFDMFDGGFAELAYCELPPTSGLTGYSCYVFNLGRQSGDWIAGDALELGLGYRPFGDDTWFHAGAGYSIIGSLIGIIACDTGDAPNESGEATCDKTRLPMEGYLSLGVHGSLPINDLNIVVSAQLRYHGSFSGDVGYEAPQGAALGVGFGFAL